MRHCSEFVPAEGLLHLNTGRVRFLLPTSPPIRKRLRAAEVRMEIDRFMVRLISRLPVGLDDPKKRPCRRSIDSDLRAIHHYSSTQVANLHYCVHLSTNPPHMRILKTLLIIVLAIVAIVVLLGLIGADTYHVDRSTVINATPEQVYPYVSNLSSQQAWGPWRGPGPNVQE